MHRTAIEILKDYEDVEEVKREEEIKIEYEEHLEIKQEEVKVENKEPVDDEQEDEKKIEYMEEVIQAVKLEYECDETFGDPVDKSYEENIIDEVQDETYSEKSDNLSYNLRRRSTNSQIKQQSFKDKNDSPPGTRRKGNRRKIKPRPLYYECKNCFEKFLNFQGLRKHREEIKHTSINRSRFSCPVCNKMIMSKFNMIKHVRTHTGEKPYCCEICGTSFSEMSNLKKHTRCVHAEIDDLIYQCPTCKRIYKNHDSLKMHQWREKDKCNRPFRLKHSIISGEKYWCNVCEKGFLNKSLLNSHSKVHTSERPYNCDVCQKLFSQPGNLKTHKLVHTGEKPHVCSVCSNAFTQPITLKRHMRIHTGEKPYSCEECDKSFSTNWALTSHKKTHIEEKLFICSVCGKDFKHSSSLKTHEQSHGEQNLDPPHLLVLPVLTIKQ